MPLRFVDEPKLAGEIVYGVPLIVIEKAGDVMAVHARNSLLRCRQRSAEQLRRRRGLRPATDQNAGRLRRLAEPSYSGEIFRSGRAEVRGDRRRTQILAHAGRSVDHVRRAQNQLGVQVLRLRCVRRQVHSPLNQPGDRQLTRRHSGFPKEKARTVAGSESVA
jgi:hypothetical protein